MMIMINKGIEKDCVNIEVIGGDSCASLDQSQVNRIPDEPGWRQNFYNLSITKQAILVAVFVCGYQDDWHLGCLEHHYKEMSEKTRQWIADRKKENWYMYQVWDTMVVPTAGFNKEVK